MTILPQDDNNIIQANPTPPDAPYWHHYLQQQREQTPQRLEEAAKFLSGMISISFTIMAANISAQLAAHQAITIIMLLFWLLSLLFAFFVLFPKQYKVVSLSADSIKAMHNKAVSVKYQLLVVSVALFVVALFLLLVLYLMPVAPAGINNAGKVFTDTLQHSH